MRKQNQVWILGMVVIATLGCGGRESPDVASTVRSGSGTESAGRSVDVLTLEMERTPVTHRATGTLRGRNTATLTSRVMGHVRRIEVRAGEQVEAGQLLAVLDDRTARASLRQASASRQEAAAAHGQFSQQVEAASASLRLAETTRARMASLLAQGAVTQQQFDEADARYQGAVAQHAAATAGISRASAGIAQARAAAEMARTNVGYARVEAPFAGVVLQVPAQVGDLMAPGAPLLILEQEGPLRAEVSVPESLAGQVAVGDAVSLSVEAANVRLVGRVEEVIPAVDARSRAFIAKVVLPSEDARLRRGMFVRAHLDLGIREALRIPMSAVSPRGALDRVFVVEGETARLRLVRLGTRSVAEGALEEGDRSAEPVVEVLAGLVPGERLVRDPQGLSDRSAVVVR